MNDSFKTYSRNKKFFVKRPIFCPKTEPFDKGFYFRLFIIKVCCFYNEIIEAFHDDKENKSKKRVL